MLGTADKLRRLAVLDQTSKDAEICGFRTSIVSKVCDLVQSEAPRAAYFRVQDLEAQSRVMRSGPYADSRNREDSFTSEFVEGQGGDQGVWNLIDRGDVEWSNDMSSTVPDSWDATRNRQYRSFVSVAVRADGIAFGMLTANTLEVDGFSDSDVASIKVLAHLLAAAEATTMTTVRIGRATQRRPH
jgi:transcriptional regulator with GAF, ATPase, and Fis domain